MSTTISLEKDSIKKLFYKFAIPSALGMFVNSLYVVADGIFITRGIGSHAIAAVNIGYPLINLAVALSLMFGVGGSTLISIYSDKPKYRNRCFSYIIMLNLVVYLIIALLVFCFTKPLMMAMGANENLLPMVKGYMYPCTLASFFLMISVSLNSVVRNDNAPKRAMNALLLGAATNIILDYVFIFKLHMGIEGGAYATAIGQILSAVYLCQHFLNSTFKFHFNYRVIDWKLIGKICNIGFSSFVLEFAVMVITILINIALMNGVGEEGAAAYGIISYSFVILRMLYTGLAQGTQPIISYNYGRRNVERVHETFMYSHKFCFIATLVTLIGMKFLAIPIVKIFTTDPSLIKMTANGLFLYSSAIIFVGANFMNISYLQSMDRSFLANTLALLRGVVFVVIGLKMLPMFLGLNGIWLGLPFSDLMTFITTLISFKVLKKYISVDAYSY